MPRYIEVPQTAENLRAMASALDEHVANLRVAADLMELQKLDTLMVTNADQRKRAMEYLDAWLAAVRSAVRKAREERGDFGPSGDDPKKKKAR